MAEEPCRVLTDKMDQLPCGIKDILTVISGIGDKTGCNVYVVGGFVRDLLIGTLNVDFDIVIEGDGILFAEELGERYGVKAVVYERFRTAQIVAQNFNIDVVTARKEHYEYPAALPAVEAGTIRDDLKRRDFTINSMAVKLNKLNFGMLVDFYGGMDDLQRGLIRILHPESFIDDPTRLFRAIRFEQRYGFCMEYKTYELAVYAVNSGVLENLSKERISNEFHLMLSEKNAVKILRRGHDLGLLDKVFPDFKFNAELWHTLERCTYLVLRFEEDLNSGKILDKIPLDRVLIYLLALYSNLQYNEAKKSLSRIKLKSKYSKEILKLVSVKDKVFLVLEHEASDYDVYNVLRGLSQEVLFAMKAIGESPVVSMKIEKFISHLKSIKLTISGKDLNDMGMAPCPHYCTIMDEVLRARLDGKIKCAEEEKEYAKMLIDKITSAAFHNCIYTGKV